jgi:hypothetical protein
MSGGLKASGYRSCEGLAWIQDRDMELGVGKDLK